MHRKYLFRHQPHPQGLRLVPLPAPLLAPATARELGVAACMFGGAAAPPGGALHPGPLAATHPIPLTLYPPTDHTSPGASVPLFALFISNRLALRCAQLNSWVGSSLAASLAACLPGCEACLFFPSPHIWLSSPAAPGCLWPAAPHCTTPHPPRVFCWHKRALTSSPPSALLSIPGDDTAHSFLCVYLCPLARDSRQATVAAQAILPGPAPFSALPLRQLLGRAFGSPASLFSCVSSNGHAPGSREGWVGQQVCRAAPGGSDVAGRRPQQPPAGPPMPLAAPSGVRPVPLSHLLSQRPSPARARCEC